MNEKTNADKTQKYILKVFKLQNKNFTVIKSHKSLFISSKTGKKLNMRCGKLCASGTRLQPNNTKVHK